MELVKNHPNRPSTFHIVTYGCQMNDHDSEKLAGMLSHMGMTATATREEAELVIFNTCCVRDNAERRALGNVNWLNTLKKQNPRLLIGVCGCMIQQPGMAEKILKQYKFIDLAFGTGNVHLLPEYLLEVLDTGKRSVHVTEEAPIVEHMPVQRRKDYFAYITIMYGCNNFCTYCIVPYVRGRERSRRAADILAEARKLKESGVKEVMLLGQNVNSYGNDTPGGISFAQLLKQLDEIGIPRIRFMTSHPKDLSDELIEVMANSRHICPHFHLPVQAGNDEILKRMNRRYTRAQYLDRVRKLREKVPGIGITTDLIVSFPGETREQFEDTLSLVREVGYDSAYTFIYSPRTGTKAAEMPGRIDDAESTARIEELIAAQDEQTARIYEGLIGTAEEVLVESLSRRSNTMVSGKGRRGISISFPGTEQDIGQIIPVRITSRGVNTLRGERMEGESQCK